MVIMEGSVQRSTLQSRAKFRFQAGPYDLKLDMLTTRPPLCFHNQSDMEEKYTANNLNKWIYST